MRVLKNIFSQLHVYIVGLILSFVLWGFVFNILTDAPAERKLVLFADVERCSDRAMAAALEAERPEGIRLVQVHSFGYAMFDETNLLNADLYIVRAQDAAGYRDSFRPLDLSGLDTEGLTLFELDGQPFGVRVWDGERGCAASFLGYGEGEYYLFVGARSLHAGEKDDAAYRMLEMILRLP